MTIISPSILSCNFLNIQESLDVLDTIDNIWIHLDIMDSHFVPNLTFGGPVIKQIAKSSSSLLDAHFMVTNPRFHIEDLKDTSIYNFTFHYEACESDQEVLELIDLAKNYFPSVGLSLRPNTEFSLSPEILEKIDILLVMSVEPGFGGQSFMESSLDKIQEISKVKDKYNFKIQIDGGISDVNSKTVINSGVDNLVAGSFVFRNGVSGIENQINKLR